MPAAAKKDEEKPTTKSEEPVEAPVEEPVEEEETEPEPYSTEAGTIAITADTGAKVAKLKITGTFDQDALISIEKQIDRARMEIS